LVSARLGVPSEFIVSTTFEVFCNFAWCDELSARDGNEADCRHHSAMSPDIFKEKRNCEGERYPYREAISWYRRTDAPKNEIGQE
jgi:hypothetical protein